PPHARVAGLASLLVRWRFRSVAGRVTRGGETRRRKTMPSTETLTEKKTERGPRNGVDTPTLFATIGAVKAQPELAKFQFRVSNRWVKGTNSRSRVESFRGAGGEHAHKGDFTYDADHPAVLVGEDRAPTPVEFLLHALASCLTAGIANIAAARGVTL